MRRWIRITMAIAIAAVFGPAAADASTSTDGVNVRYKIQPILQLSVTPNYATGYGAIKANFGGAPGTLQTGAGAPAAVDFGSVYQGSAYLYRYAAKVSVNTNTPFNLYGEGTADLTGTSGAATGTTTPINQSLFWLLSNDGSTTDPNNGYSPSTPFMATTQGGASFNNPSITYATYPAPIYSGATNATLFYDYQMRLGATVNTGAYSVFVVYTAVPQ